MKRRREMEMVASEIRSAIEELSLLPLNVKTSAAADDVSPLPLPLPLPLPVPVPVPVPVQTSVHIPIKPFLSLCNLLLQVLDKIGPTMAVFRQDIHHNIERLEKFHETDPSIYWDVVEILKKEVNEGKAKKGPTCSKAFLWLNRSLDFAVALLDLLVQDFEKHMEQAVEESYNITIKPWHGWISSAAYRVALKLVPDSRTLVEILKVKGEEDDTLKKDIKKLISLLIPVLDQNKDILRAYGLDKLKST